MLSPVFGVLDAVSSCFASLTVAFDTGVVVATVVVDDLVVVELAVVVGAVVDVVVVVDVVDVGVVVDVVVVSSGGLACPVLFIVKTPTGRFPEHLLQEVDNSPSL